MSENFIAKMDDLECVTTQALIADESTHSLEIVTAEIKRHALSVDRDMTTAKGRAAITSLGERVRKSRIHLETKIKEYTDGVKGHLKNVESRKAKMTLELNALIDEIQAPVKEFKIAEEKRIEGLKQILRNIRSLGEVTPATSSAEIQNRINQFNAQDPTQWAEFLQEAELTKTQVLQSLVNALPAAQANEAMAEQNRIMAEKLKALEASQPIAKDVRHQVIQSTVIGGNGVNIPVAPQTYVQRNQQADQENQGKALQAVQAWFTEHMGMPEMDSKYIFNAVFLDEIPHLQLKDI